MYRKAELEQWKERFDRFQSEHPEDLDDLVR
jgi:hypothetical protein